MGLLHLACIAYGIFLIAVGLGYDAPTFMNFDSLGFSQQAIFRMGCALLVVWFFMAFNLLLHNRNSKSDLDKIMAFIRN